MFDWFAGEGFRCSSASFKFPKYIYIHSLIHTACLLSADCNDLAKKCEGNVCVDNACQGKTCADAALAAAKQCTEAAGTCKCTDTTKELKNNECGEKAFFFKHLT